mgnify:CR=1 FL=1
MWQDANGHYHILSHNGARGDPTPGPGDCGRHYFSQTGAAGTWRVTNLGKRFFRDRAPPNTEYVLCLPVLFHIQKGDHVVEHTGWFPVTDLEPALRERLETVFPQPRGNAPTPAPPPMRFGGPCVRQ